MTGGLAGGIAGGVVYIVLCAIIAANAAETGRSGGGYFFLSLLLSPLVGFMTLSLSMLAKIEIAQNAQAPETPRRESNHEVASGITRLDLTWDCPECREKNPNSTFVCEKCGYSLK